MKKDPKPKRKEGVIVSKRKDAVRNMRSTSRKNPDGPPSSVKMESGEASDIDRKKFKYVANPTLFPSKDGSWKDLGGKGTAAYKEATKRGEVVGYKREKRAVKLAAGSWKQGEDKNKQEIRSAVKQYKKRK